MKAARVIFIFIVYFLQIGAMDVSSLSGVLGHSDLFNSSTITELVRQRLKGLILVKNISCSKRKIDSEILSTNGVAFSPDSTIFATAHCSLTGPILKVRSSKNNKALLEYKDDEVLSFKCMAFSNDGKTLVSGLGGRLYFWNTESWKITREISLDTIDAYSLAFSKGGTKMIVGSSMGLNNLAIFTSTEKGRIIRLLSGHGGGNITSVGFSPDGTRAVSVSGNTAKIWDATRGDMLYEICGKSWSGCKIEYDKNDEWFLSGYEEYDGVLGYWFGYNLNTKEAITAPLGIIVPKVNAYDRSACGDYIFLGNAENGNVAVFNICTQQYIYTIETKGCAVSKMACSSDGKYLAVAINEGIQHSLWSYNLMRENDQAVLTAINSADSEGLQFLQDVLPKAEGTMIFDETILDNTDFKNLPQPLRTLFHGFIDRKNSSFDQSFINMRSDDDDWSLID